jgi:ATP-binding cassette subfamily B protein
MNAAPNFSLLRVDHLVVNYVKSRRSHFRVLFRQALGIYVSPGDHKCRSPRARGWLVINRELTLRQVVASEIGGWSAGGA